MPPFSIQASGAAAPKSPLIQLPTPPSEPPRSPVEAAENGLPSDSADEAAAGGRGEGIADRRPKAL